MTETNESLALRATAFAAEVHTHQRRKGAAAEPYVNHVIEVGAALAAAGAPLAAILAGLLHDTIEDGDSAGRPVTEAELAERFGEEVAAIVAEVTDDKALPKAERKRLQIEKAPGKSAAARMVKLADKAANLRAITVSPPPSWDLARKRDYIDWAEAVAAGCRGVNPTLEAAFDTALALARTALEDQTLD
ncbi:HD domain-containing protein [Elioraea rosea]|uniref:HD domain-containing protein n=1 Tax=Elioraea rosea TaxID=2492390 RepID=UPI001182F986|nr:HD domain-containing protein [Elioraea rosea]